MTKLSSWILALFLISSAMVTPVKIVGPIKIALAPMNEPYSSEAWAMFRHDPRHTGVSTSEAPDRLNVTAGMVWTGEIVGRISYSSCAVANGTVFIGSRYGWIYAFNEKNGELIWKNETTGAIYSSPAVSHGKVFIGSEDGKVYALDATTGKIIGNRTIGPAVYSSPAIADGTVFIGSFNNTVYALDETLQVKWKSFTGRNIRSSPAVADDMVFIGCYDGKVYAFNETNGNIIWVSNQTAGQIIYSSPTVVNERVFIGSGNDLYALNEFDGTVNWTRSTDGFIQSSPAVADGRVFIGSEDNKIHAFDEDTGGSVWSYETDGDVHSSPAVANGKVFVASNDGYLYALNATAGEPIWKCKTDGEIDSSPAVADGMVFVGSDKVYAFGPNNPPKADFDYTPEDPNVNQTITFDASNSSDPDEKDHIVDYTWDFGDDSPSITETDPITTHEYKAGGNYTVTLTVTDSHDATNSTWKVVEVFVSIVVVTDVTPASYSVTKGETVNINVTVENRGDFNETNCPITAYWANETDKGEIGTQHVNLTIGESENVTIPWDTSTVARGEYVISANETIDGTVLVGLHDLAVTNVTATSTEVLFDSGENVSISVTVENLGDFIEHFNVTVYWTNTTMEGKIGNKTNESLPPRGSTIFPINWSTASLAVGNYTIRANVTIDPDDINPTNNNFTNGIVRIRQPIPDVNVSDVKPYLATPPYFVVKGDTVNIDVTVCNIGEKNLTNVPVTTYWANETMKEQIGTTLVEKIGPGCTVIHSTSFRWNTTNFSVGLYNISAYANLTCDPTPENNVNYCNITIITLEHDVGITSVWPSKDQVYTNTLEGIYVYVEVLNIGNCTEAFNVTAYATDARDTTPIPPVDQKTPSLEPGSSCPLTFGPWVPGWPPSVYTIWAVANLTDPAYTDPTPENNVFDKNVTVHVLEPIHDVAIIEVRPPAPPVYNGTRRNIDVIVQNPGAYPEYATLIVYANYTQIWNTTNLELEPEDPTTIPVPWDIPSFPDETTYVINATIIIDDDANPSDNYATCTLTVETGKWHDVAVIGDPTLTYKNYKYAFYLSPTHPERQLTMNVSVTIANFGLFNEEVNVTVFLRLAHGDHNETGPVGSQPLISLAPEETRTVTIACCVWNNSDIERDIRKYSLPTRFWIMATASISIDNDTSNNINHPHTILTTRVRVTIPTDITGSGDRVDGKVDMQDVAWVARGFGYGIGEPYYDLRRDITGLDYLVPDGEIDMRDIATVARDSGIKEYPP